ncbi:MAG: glycosyl hydrolase [Verrucomicrobiota bacterium]
MNRLLKHRLLAGLFALSAATACSAAGTLEEDFKTPPEFTKPRCYWYWLDGHVTKEGLTQDLEAMQRVGIGEAYIAAISGQSQMEAGPVKVLGEPFWEAMTHAMREGTRTGVDIGVFNSPGWSQSGGPWVKPDQAMRHLVHSELRLKGPQRYDGKLPAPEGDYQDVSLIAYPAPTGEDAKSIAAFEGEVIQEPTSVTITLPQAVTARSLRITPTAAVRVAARLEASADGEFFTTVRSFTVDRHNLELNVGPTPLAPVTIGFPEVQGRVFRIVLNSAADLGEVRLSAATTVDYVAEKSLEKAFQDPLPPFDFYSWPLQPEPVAKGCAIAPESIVDLRKNLAEDGSFGWDVPAGDWIVQRVSMVPTGTKNGPAAPEATGLEVDKMNRSALKAHFDAYIGELIQRLTPEDRKSWKHVVADSYEMGPQNWTDGFAADFREAFGYDPTRFLPVMRGRMVGSSDASDRFLWDLRRYVADRVATEYVGGLRDLCHENGLKLWLENYGHWGFPSEFLHYGGQADEVSGEFWESGELGQVELRAASSAAHIYGKRQVFAEAWTGGPPFRSTPASLKKRGDWALCEGVNQFVFHVNIHQPSDERLPGVSAWFGTEFNRHNTWFEMSRTWIDYLRRCSFLLQQGLHVADVAYFIGEDAPKMTGTRNPALPTGYDFDYINADTLLHRAKVENQRLVLPDGMSYRVLVLPPSETMRPEMLEKIKAFVDAGLTVIGPLPTRSPSLQGFPGSDEKVRQLSAALKDKVVNTGNLQDALALPPDLAGKPEQVIFTHRRSEDADLYFLSNQGDTSVRFEPVFRIVGKVPELWHPDSGEIERPPCVYEDEVTRVPLYLDAGASVFVVFRKETNLRIVAKRTRNLKILTATYEAVDGAGALDVTARLEALAEDGRLEVTVNNEDMGGDPIFGHVKQLRVDAVINGQRSSFIVPERQRLNLSSGVEISGPWELAIGPRKVVLDRLRSWSDRPEPDIRYHSGEAVYRTHFQQPETGRNTITLLDLGTVESLAEVTLNGQTFPILWKPPYRLDISAALRAGSNELSIRVVNTWHNRLVGERLGVQDLGAPKVWTSAFPAFPENEPLLPAGLIGPVRLPIMEVMDSIGR